MKKIAIIGIVALLLALAVPFYAAVGAVTKSTGKDAVALIPAVDMFPESEYDNIYQIPGAKGKVNMIQPNGNVDVILGVSADGLAPDSQYLVYFDINGVTQYDNSTIGPSWQPQSTFRTDNNGHGEWNYTAPAGSLGAGSYTWSVWINQMAPSTPATVLISHNVGFAVE